MQHASREHWRSEGRSGQRSASKVRTPLCEVSVGAVFNVVVDVDVTNANVNGGCICMCKSLQYHF
jgi:hypothetical protein